MRASILIFYCHSDANLAHSSRSKLKTLNNHKVKHRLCSGVFDAGKSLQRQTSFNQSPGTPLLRSSTRSIISRLGAPSMTPVVRRLPLAQPLSFSIALPLNLLLRLAPLTSRTKHPFDTFAIVDGEASSKLGLQPGLQSLVVGALNLRTQLAMSYESGRKAMTYDDVVAVRTWSTTRTWRVVKLALYLFDQMRATIAGTWACWVVTRLVGSVGFVVAGVVRGGLATHVEKQARRSVRERVVRRRDDDRRALCHSLATSMTPKNGTKYIL